MASPIGAQDHRPMAWDWLPWGSIPGGQFLTASEVCLSQVKTFVMFTAWGPGASSIHLLLTQEEQMVLVSGQEVRRPLASWGQFFSTLGGGEKKDPVIKTTSAVSAQISSSWGQRAWEDRTWAELHNIPLSSAQVSPVPSASKTSIHFSPPCPCHLQSRPSELPWMPAHILSLTLPIVLPENEYFPTAAGGSFKTLKPNPLPPQPSLLSLRWPQTLCTCCALHQECPSLRFPYGCLLLILDSINVPSSKRLSPS